MHVVVDMDTDTDMGFGDEVLLRRKFFQVQVAACFVRFVGWELGGGGRTWREALGRFFFCFLSCFLVFFFRVSGFRFGGFQPKPLEFIHSRCQGFGTGSEKPAAFCSFVSAGFYYRLWLSCAQSVLLSAPVVDVPIQEYYQLCT